MNILFDKDGTLMDYEAFWAPISMSAVCAICAEYALTEAQTDGVLRTMGLVGGKTDVSYATYGVMAAALYECLASFHVSCTREEVEQGVARAFARYRTEGRIVPTAPDLREALLRLHEDGNRLFLVTSDREEMTRHCLSVLGISELFEEIVCDDGVHPHKPDPYYAHELCARHGFSPASFMMVGDTVSDMLFAKNVGAIACGVGKGTAERAALAAHADLLLRDASLLGRGVSMEALSEQIRMKQSYEKIRAMTEEGYQLLMRALREELPNGRYELAAGAYANVFSYETKPRGAGVYEAHRKFIDIHVVLGGEEIVAVEDLATMHAHECIAPYLEETEAELYADHDEGREHVLRTGDCLILHPADAHMVGIAPDASAIASVKKMVIKVPVTCMDVT